METHYLCIQKDGKTMPIMGPLSQREVVGIIVAQGSDCWRYGNASRYDLKKAGYPFNKAGDHAIKCSLMDSQPERWNLNLKEPIRLHGALGHFLGDKKFKPTPTGI